jgi:CMP-N,N'-diacetyllegionaminic acid synthase
LFGNFNLKKRILAIIPARGGSKGVPRKNIKQFAGKPLIAWTIEAARQSHLIDHLIVSTDDLEIADVAKSYGASVPFLRPPQFATDEAAGIDPVIHAIEQLPGYEYIILLQPTSPLRTTEDIDNSITKCLAESATSCVSITEATTHPYSCFSLIKNTHLRPVIQSAEKYVRRQDMPQYYALNGAIYIASVEFLVKNRTFVGEETGIFIMPKSRSIDIDDTEDFAMAEFLMSNVLLRQK